MLIGERKLRKSFAKIKTLREGKTLNVEQMKLRCLLASFASRFVKKFSKNNLPNLLQLFLAGKKFANKKKLIESFNNEIRSSDVG